MLLKRIDSEFIESYISGNHIKKNTLGILKTKISEWKSNKQNTGKDIQDENIFDIIASEVKKRKQAIAIYDSNISDNAKIKSAKESAEMEILSAFLPTQMSVEEIQSEIYLVTQANPIKLYPAIMQHFSKNFKGRYDNKFLQELLKK